MGELYSVSSSFSSSLGGGREVHFSEEKIATNILHTLAHLEINFLHYRRLLKLNGVVRMQTNLLKISRIISSVS